MQRHARRIGEIGAVSANYQVWGVCLGVYSTLVGQITTERL